MANEKNSFKSAVNKHYQKLELSEQQLAALNNPGPKAFNFKKLSGLAASFLLVVIFFGFSKFKQVGYQDIAQEVAYNHNSQMQMEVRSSSLTDIQSYLHRLDFTLVDSLKLTEGNWQLMGGRYCSISGKIAAQLTIKNLTNGKVYTYYQSRLDNLSRKESKIDVDGVSVTLWHEKGLLLSLAQ